MDQDTMNYGNTEPDSDKNQNDVSNKTDTPQVLETQCNTAVNEEQQQLGIFGMFNDNAAETIAANINSTTNITDNNDKIINDVSSIHSSNYKDVNENLSFINKRGKKIVLKKKQNLQNNSNKEFTEGKLKNDFFVNNNNQFKDFIGKKNIITTDSTYGINVNQLMDNIRRKKENESSKVCTSKNDEKNGDDDGTNGKSKNDKLWVEKYRPNNFFSLVGNERLNRRMLKWLKHWDPVVFGEALNEKLYNNQQTGLYPGNDNSTTNINQQKKIEEQMDPFNRPAKKIMLIHGPPGIGKTSVAHVLSKQCGFNVMEINSSDERSGDNVKFKLENILFNQTFNGKPNVLICDEIDGAVEYGFIKYLLDIIQADNKATTQFIASNFSSTSLSTNNKNQEKKRERAKLLKKILKRPIIAICNNLYSKPLEKLRPNCEIIQFIKPSDVSISSRLENILNLENYQITKKSMNKLIEICDSDIRNCLNNLQFLSMYNDSRGTNNTGENNRKMIDMFSSETESLEKDIPLSWYQLVNQIFQKSSHLNSNEVFIKLLNKLELQNSSSTIDRIINGCFDNYHKMKYSDIGLQKPSKLADWLYFYDVINGSIYSGNSMGMEISRYITTIPMIFHQFFGDIDNARNHRGNNGNTNSTTDNFQFNNIQFEIQTNKKKLEAMIDSMRHAIDPVQLSIYYNKNASLFNLEIIPYLNELLNIDYLKKIHDPQIRNDVIMESVLPLLKNFHILMRLDNSGSSSNEFKSSGNVKMFPPLNELANINPVININHRSNTQFSKGFNNNFSSSSSSSTSQSAHKLLLSKLEEAKAKHLKLHASSTMSSTSNTMWKRNRDDENSDFPSKKPRYSNDNHNDKDKKVNSTSESKKASPPPIRNSIEFFKQKYANTPSSNISAASSSNDQVLNGEQIDSNSNTTSENTLDQGRIWIKYKEGFSNAVRKKVTWETLFE